MARRNSLNFFLAAAFTVGISSALCIDFDSLKLFGNSFQPSKVFRNRGNILRSGGEIVSKTGKKARQSQSFLDYILFGQSTPIERVPSN